MGRYLIAALLLIVAYYLIVGMLPIGAGTTQQHGSRATTVQNRAIAKYVEIARQDARDAGIDEALFVRQINQESGFNPAALSTAGAIGIAQFMPATAKTLGINPYEPLQSLKAAALLMSGYVRVYHDYAMALAAYNAGPGTLATAVNQCSLLWRHCLPDETQAYIHSIMS